MIDRNDTFHSGRITRIRGLKGEVELRFTDDAFDRGDSPYLFMDMDGLLVPFFWEEYGFKNKETAIFSFEDIDTEDNARRLVGREVYYPLEALPDEEEEDFELSSYNALTGFRVRDDRAGASRDIPGVDESSPNVLLYIDKEDGDELILPYHDDFLVDFNLKKRTLTLHLPDELVELNK